MLKSSESPWWLVLLCSPTSPLPKLLVFSLPPIGRYPLPTHFSAMSMAPALPAHPSWAQWRLLAVLSSQYTVTRATNHKRKPKSNHSIPSLGITPFLSKGKLSSSHDPMQPTRTVSCSPFKIHLPAVSSYSILPGLTGLALFIVEDSLSSRGIQCRPCFYLE